MTGHVQDLAAIDVSAPGLFVQPGYFDLLARLRREAPVLRCDNGIWLLSRYDDIRGVSRDPRRFISRRGVLVDDPLRAAGGEADPTYSILHLDPPLHARYRALINRMFTPRAVAPLEASIRAIVGQVLDALPLEEPIDLVDAVAAPIPIAVIAEFFGVPDADRALFRRWSDAAIDTSSSKGSEQAADFAEMARFLLDHIDSPATEHHDVLNTLKHASLDGRRPLDRAEIMSFCLTLLIAGNETTRHLISGGAMALAEHPDQRAALVGSAAGVPAAVEELLRWVTPVQAFGRTTATDVEIDDVPIPAGEFVVMLYASGNRDEAVFGPTASMLDIHRPVSPAHVAFGFGEHLCLGASLARLEARVVFEELLARFPAYELAGEPVFLESTLVRGLRSLAVVLKR